MTPESPESSKEKVTALDTPPNEKIEALHNLSMRFGSDLTKVVTTNDAGELLTVGIFARPPYAAPLLAFIEELEERPEVDEEAGL
jgi:hypothetical protein